MAAEAQTNHSRRILLVDDDDILRDASGRVLERAGFHVLTAQDGKKALRILEEGSVDLVITDLVMPELDGLELIRELRRGAGPPILAISGESGWRFLQMAMVFGAQGTLLKPYSIEQLMEAGAAGVKGRRGRGGKPSSARSCGR